MTARTLISWTPAMDADLLRMRAEGVSFTKIARYLGVTKNAVVGRAHRVSDARRLVGVAIRPLVEVGRPGLRCQWIEGEPAMDDACKCGAAAKAGTPYCDAHYRRCYSTATECSKTPDAQEALS
jgi:hypothetical protein